MATCRGRRKRSAPRATESNNLQYTVGWNGLTLGIMEGDAGCPTLECVNHAEVVNNTDAYGKTTIDAIYQGGDWFAQMTCIEYRAGSIGAVWPFGQLGVLGVIGRLYYASIASSLVLTAIAGTPAAASPATLTATKAVIAPGFSSRWLFGPTLRKIPLRFQLLPTGANVAFFTTT